MKKHIILTAALFCFFAASVIAQDSTKQSVTPTAPVSTDKWNSSNPSQYQLLPMPEALTIEKSFPAIGKYQLTDKDGNAVAVTAMLDETNKGVLLVNGLPEGSIKAYLRKSPAVYKIPAQKTADEKDVKEGVLIYDKDANVMNICFGCTYNNEDPATAFLPVQEDQAPVEEAPKKNTKTSKKSTAKKVEVAKPVHYTGTKLASETALLK